MMPKLCHKLLDIYCSRSSGISMLPTINLTTSASSCPKEDRCFVQHTKRQVIGNINIQYRTLLVGKISRSGQLSELIV